MKTKDITFMAMMVSFISVSSQISIPIGQVPITLQTLMILLTSLILGSKKGMLTVLIYVFIGAIGFPVFAGFSSGIGVLFLQTGGFILSFPLMAYIAGLFSEKTDNKLLIYIGSIVGTIVNFIFGTIYFMYVTELGLSISIGYTVIPFIPTTIVQIILAVEISERLKTYYKNI